MNDELAKKDQFADEAELMGDVAEMEGILDVAQGLDDLEAAGEIEDVSRDALAAGSSDMTRGIDEMLVADRAAVLSEAVATAGVVDLA